MSADAAPNASTEVVVVIGAGAIGQAIARRIGAAKTLLLATSTRTRPSGRQPS
jgi:phosphoglycerate dehydrogenase-like enzyme